jgi:hypothetical protein
MDHVEKLQRQLAAENRKRGVSRDETAEYKQHLIVEAAVLAVREILEVADAGSLAQDNYLLSAVALRLVESVHDVHRSALLRHDLENRRPEP